MSTSRLALSAPVVSGDFDSTESRFVWLIYGASRTCLLAALIAAPWFFGGLATRIQLMLGAVIAIAMILWLVAATYQSLTVGIRTNRIPQLMLPLLALFGLGIYQVDPKVGVPTREEIQTRIDSAMERSSDESQRRILAKDSLVHSLQTGESISRVTTRFELARLILVIVTFFLSVQLFSTPKAQMWLWSSLAANGVALSFFGICQKLSWNGKLFWTFPLKFQGSPFSSFVNRNNAAGYLCICFAAALGMLFLAFSPTYAAMDFVDDDRFRLPQPRNRKRPDFWRKIFDSMSDLSIEKCASGIAVILIVAGIIAAMSRGGWLALGCATVVTGLIVFKRHGSMAFGSLFFVGLMSVGLVYWSGLGKQIQERWGNDSLVDTIVNDGRWTHWQDSIKAGFDFPLTGTGFGTYQFAYLPYQNHAGYSHLRFYNADNQFLEWFVEGGFIGLSLVLLSICLACRAVGVLLKRSQSEPSGITGLFAIVSQCVSAFFDFGPTMPANMLALAMLFGAVTGRAALIFSLKRQGSRPWGVSFPALRPAFLIPAIGCLLLVSCLVSLKELKAAADVHAVSQYLPKLDSPDVLSEESTSKLIDQLSAAITNYPGDPDAHLSLAVLFMHRFRLQEFQQTKLKQAQKNEVWLKTDPAFFYRQINVWDRAGQLERIEAFLDRTTFKENLAPAYDQLILAQTACQTIPDVSQFLAILNFVIHPESPTGENFLRRALIVSPANPETFYQVGQLGDFADLTDFSFACWRKSLELNGRFLPEIHRALTDKISLVEEAERVIPSSASLLLQLAQMYTSAESKVEREFLANRAVKLLSLEGREEESDAERQRNFGMAHKLLGDAEVAISDYRKALALSPYRIDWRLELIQILRDFKGVDFAIREAETCLVIAPNQKEIQSVLQNLFSRLAQEKAQPNAVLRSGLKK